MADRHNKDLTRVVAIRIPTERYNTIVNLIANSPLPHNTVGGYIAWILETQVFRKR